MNVEQEKSAVITKLVLGFTGALNRCYVEVCPEVPDKDKLGIWIVACLTFAASYAKAVNLTDAKIQTLFEASLDSVKTHAGLPEFPRLDLKIQ